MSNDSIRWVDQAVKPIPTADTWENLSVNQLLETQSMLQDKAFAFKNNEAITRALKPALAQLEALIDRKLNENN